MNLPKKQFCMIAFSLAVSLLLPNMVLARVSGAAGSNHSRIKNDFLKDRTSCSNALDSAQTRIQDGREIITELRFSEVSSQWNDTPRGRPKGLLVAMQGNYNQMVNVMSSPQFLTAIATKIINDCQDVSLVAFTVHATEGGIVYGLVNGQVQQFQCTTDESPRWGFMFCIFQ